MRLKKSSNRKKTDEYTNFIINNLGYAQSVNILIENARETAEYMVNNNCKIEDFHIYLDKEKRNVGEGGAEQKKEKGFFGSLIDSIFNRKTSVEEIQEQVTPAKKNKGPTIFGKRQVKK